MYVIDYDIYKHFFVPTIEILDQYQYIIIFYSNDSNPLML